MLPLENFKNLHAVMAILVPFEKFSFRQVLFKFFDPTSEWIIEIETLHRPK